MTKASNKTPDATDVHVGGLIRLRRVNMGISQEKLGEEIGVTFQQVQKYEKGANRVGSSRLQAIATALNVTPAFFFQGAPGSNDERAQEQAEELRLLALPGAIDLLKAYAVSSTNGQRSLVNIAQQVAA